MPRRPSKQATKRRLDTEFSKAMRARVSVCEKCGIKGAQLHVHHAVVGRANHRCRWMPQNIVVLCAACHRRAHNYPFEFRDWFAENRRDDLEAVQSVCNEIRSYSVHDYLDMIEDLRAA